LGLETAQPVLLKPITMEDTKEHIEPLLQKAEAYSKTSLKILQLKVVEKTAEVTAAFISRLLLIAAISFFLIAVNTALALWLGELLGKTYYGFLLLGLLYAVVAAILSLLQPLLKGKIGNLIITQLLN
jgi:uncharacterized membrane protein